MENQNELLLLQKEGRGRVIGSLLLMTVIISLYLEVQSIAIWLLTMFVLATLLYLLISGVNILLSLQRQMSEDESLSQTPEDHTLSDDQSPLVCGAEDVMELWRVLGVTDIEDVTVVDWLPLSKNIATINRWAKQMSDIFIHHKLHHYTNGVAVANYIIRNARIGSTDQTIVKDKALKIIILDAVTRRLIQAQEQESITPTLLSPQEQENLTKEMEIHLINQ